MRYVFALISIVILGSCQTDKSQSREILDFNSDWKFSLGDIANGEAVEFEDSGWTTVSAPHDWSIELGYQKDGDVASSTGFVPGGIGWYRKAFTLTEADKDKVISVLFDGVYNNSTVWLNGQLLGKRPNGYIAFSYDLTPHLKFDGTPNVMAVKVDRTAYVDSRWYTGSGIYRNVNLIKSNPLHVKLWGTKITTPTVSDESAEVAITTQLDNKKPLEGSTVELEYIVKNGEGNVVDTKKVKLDGLDNSINISIANPTLWSVDNPSLYTLETIVYLNGAQVDNTTETFGIRYFNFDSNKGFSLNGKPLKIKGVNIHHDAGAVGAAVPKSIWEYRVEKLKSIGVNAIRMAHNPHATELMDVCDEMGILVMAEAFDEWFNAKGKNKVYIGDNAAKGESAKSYPEVFNEWAERDLKDLIKRDFNHPSVIMWSIGNEIEWTFPHYSKAYNEVNPNAGSEGYDKPIYDPEKIKPVFEASIDGTDPMTEMAKQLVKWVKEEDTSRPTTCGSTLPSIGLVSGYGTTVDVYGFNYRQTDYDDAHEFYPDLKILGSENWGAYSEWKEVVDRDFVAGIFCWTGFAYLGEAGPWPRKGLNISFFDYAGFKTPRGHFYETLWKDEPKVYMVTTPAAESEFSMKDGKWQFDIQYTPAPIWSKLRLWEWYKVNEKWNYADDESIVVQTYTNCEEAELFLNGQSLGKQKLADVMEDDHILKWMVPYETGELKVVGYNNGAKVDEYILRSQGKVAKVEIETTKNALNADGYDVAAVSIKLLDENGAIVTDADAKVSFAIEGEGKNIGIDNGWEMNVQSHAGDETETHDGRAIVFLQSTKNAGSISITAKVGDVSSETLTIQSE